MYASPTTKLIAGVFSLLGIAALIYLSVRLGRVDFFSSPGYTIYAGFDDVSGLKNGDAVEIAGVKVGKVTGVRLVNNRAQVALRLAVGVAVDADAIAGIKTSGIIGDKYVLIQLGPSSRMLSNGGVIRNTQSAFVLEDAIGQLINSSNSSGHSARSKELR